ncbi:Major facilitator superfamily domain, general substrate transporter [Akanthomyces lecanii RCEF 1005]|uniref:Major facilitator superfamily domain, general substrate transporter n=1 Tax=Akanthomyces lecanii RCEF 1005 TaxID=1081108 RepID=A0A162KQM7_CORDF|nr:Major facilitator superfamily domain, general substrate transporter [Akanthomyces lecanii RCEF 1005]
MSEFGEDILCRNRFREHGGAAALVLRDPRCKGAAVQADLSMLQAVEHTFGAIPSILTSVLYGVASDRFGRKSIMCLSIAGLLVLYAVDFTIYYFPDVFNIYLVWPAALLVFIGGGPPVMNSMTFAMVSDVVSEAERSNIFFYLVATALVGNLVGAPLTFYLMEYGPWTATAVGYSCYMARLFVVFFFCQDMKRNAVLLFQDDETQPAVEDDDKGAVAAAFRTMLNPVLAIKQTWSAGVEVFWIHKKLGILLFTLLFSDLGGYANILFNQYIAKRFDWSWSEANLLASVTTFSRLALMIAIMPLISQVLNKTGMPPIVKDAQISRYAMLLATVSAFGIGIASTFYAILPFLPLSTFRAVSRASLNSLLPSLAGPERTGALYSVMAVLDSIGMMIAAPATAAIFKSGLRLGGMWIGLPYILSGVLMMISTAILFAVRIANEDHFNATGL